MSRRRLVGAVLCVLAGGCSPQSSGELADVAQRALGRSDYAAARQAAEAGLAAAGAAEDDGVRFRLERLSLEACAGVHDVPAVLAALDALAERWPERAGPDLYVRTATQLTRSGDPLDAVDVINLGAERFPDRGEDFAALIALLEERARNGTDADRERLEGIAYLGGG